MSRSIVTSKRIPFADAVQRDIAVGAADDRRIRGEDRGTTVTLTWVPMNATEPERQTFQDALPSMAGGWGGSFDQLDRYLREG